AQRLEFPGADQPPAQVVEPDALPQRLCPCDVLVHGHLLAAAALHARSPSEGRATRSHKKRPKARVAAVSCATLPTSLRLMKSSHTLWPRSPSASKEVVKWGCWELMRPAP